MVSETLLDALFGIVSGFFSILPDISWDVDSGIFDVVLGIFASVGYLLPWGTVAAIAALIVSFTVFRIIISLIKSLWDLLPFV